ncbi:MAG: hypothetical protein QXT68_02180 [Halobacteria archaeon]
MSLLDRLRLPGRHMRHARVLVGALAGFDIWLGGTALLAPAFYVSLLHPGTAGDPTYLLQRTGVVWLGYAAFQAVAALRAPKEPAWLLVVAALRLIEVPADPVYIAGVTGLSQMGLMGIGGAPVFNLVVGLYLAAVWGGAREPPRSA